MAASYASLLCCCRDVCCAVNRAVARVVTAAQQGLDLEDLTEVDLDALLDGEEFEVSHPAAEDEEADESAEGQAGAAAADSSPAASAASQVERCKRAMQQYSLKGVAAPVTAGSGDRWLLQKRNTLMKSVGLEDMSKTPAHVLLQPLRLAVYGSLGLSSVTEYMCVIDEQWRSWANGRVVEVPAIPKSKRGGKRFANAKAHAADAQPVHPAVKKLVADVFTNILGTAKPAAADAAEADGAGAAATAAEGAEKPAAIEDAAKPAAADDVAAAAEPAAAAEEAAAGADDDGIDPIVRKLVSAAMAKAVAAAIGRRAAARANKPALPYEPLPKPLPQKPADLASLLLRHLRALDKNEQQFTKTHEKLLQLQVGSRLLCTCAEP
jgi:hypothetical protein